MTVLTVKAVSKNIKSKKKFHRQSLNFLDNQWNLSRLFGGWANLHFTTSEMKSDY